MKKLLKIVANKYFIVSAIFVLWVAFFDQNDWMTLRDRKQELNTVKGNIAYLQGEIKTMSAEKKALVADAAGNLNDPQKLEQYAREQYRMKHDNEDVYVIGE
ncbi:MAG: septum formation initiator family protein [Taibaiella sp.]|nr:septum formation initiator family protein [Taibaiella sp.]